MRILCINIKNLNSLQVEAKIDFRANPLRDAGLFAITGDTGAGKTTILDALTLALYGKIARVKQARPGKQLLEVMSYGTAESWAEVEFSAGKEEYRAKWSIRRARGKIDGNILDPKRELSQFDPKTSEYQIIATKIKEVDQQVEAITGLDYDRFKRSVLLAQGDFAAFLNADERERSELLEQITGTDIYTNLSIAAFQKYKLENEKWQSQQEELERLDILDGDALAALEEEQSQVELEINSFNVQLEQLRQAKAKWLQLEQLKNRKKTLTEEKEKWNKYVNSTQAAAIKLERHQILEPFAEQLQQLSNQEKERQILQNEIQDQQAEVLSLANQLNQVSIDFTAQEQTLNQHQIKAKQEQQLFEEVMLLDKEIEIQEQDLAGPMAVLTRRETELQQLATEIDRDQRLQQQQEQEASDIKKQLEQRAEDVQLAAIITSLEQSYQNWQLLNQDVSQRKTVAAKSFDQLQQLEQKEKLAQQKLSAAQKELLKIEDQFKANLPEDWPSDRAEILDELSQRLSQLREQHQQLEQLYRLAKEYQQLLARHNETSGELIVLQQEEEELNKRMLSLIDRKESLDRELEKRRQLYEQQQRIANYANDRQELAEGEACPLCFATEHPFRQMDLVPFVNETKRDYEKVKVKVDAIQKELIALIGKQSETNSLIRNIQGQQDESRDSQINLLNQEIYQLELSIAAVQSQVSVALGGRPGLRELESAIKESSNRISSFESRQRLLQRLFQSLNSQEKQVAEWELEHADTLASLQGLKDLWKSQEHYQKEAEQRRDDAQKELLQQLAHRDLKPNVQQLGESIKQLRQRAKSYQELTERQQKIDRDLTALSNLLTGRLENLETGQAQLKQLRSQLATSKSSLEQLQQKRRQLFGDQSVSQRRQVLEQAELGYQKLVDQLRQKLSGLQENVRAKEQVNQERQNRLQKLEDSLLQLNQVLTKVLPPLGFTDLTAARQARIAAEEAKQLQDQQNELKAKQAEIDRLHREWEKEYQQLELLIEDAPALPLIEEQLQQLQQKLQDGQQLVGAIREKLNQNEQRRKKSQNLVKQIENQKKEALRWAKLNEIIGQADGKKFRSFAQGLTLRKLCYLANQYLQKLNGRYLIHKIEKEDLALEIIDTYQADNHRPMSTLSGGESFLVSLALALGLSDLAGRKAQIQSLFIDEGFGTLDENSLDLAISTLENLQAAGKTIGIISHVKALKERIGTQIRVEKGAGGRSWLEIV